MSKIIKLTESDLTRIVRRVLSEQIVTDLSKLGFEKWGKGYILRLPKGSTPQNDIIRITAQQTTGPNKFLVSVMVNGNAKMRSEIKNGITVFRDVQSTFRAKLIRQDDKFESVSGEITGYELEKLVKKLLSLKYDPKNNIFTLNESRIVRRVLNEGMGPGNFKVGQVFDEVHNRQYIMALSYTASGRGDSTNYNDFEFSKPKVVSVDKDSITLKIYSGFYNPNDVYKSGQNYVNLNDFCLVVPYSNIQEVRDNQLMIATNNDMLEYRIDKGCTKYNAKLAEKAAKAKKCGHASWEAYKKSNWSCNGRQYIKT